MTAGVGCARPSRHALLDVFPIVCLLLLPACSLICLQPLLHHASSNFCPCCGLTDCGVFLFALWVLGGGDDPVWPPCRLYACILPACRPVTVLLLAIMPVACWSNVPGPLARHPFVGWPPVSARTACRLCLACCPCCTACRMARFVVVLLFLPCDLHLGWTVLCSGAAHQPPPS